MLSFSLTLLPLRLPPHKLSNDPNNNPRGLFRTFTHRGPPSLTLSLHAHFFSAIQRSPLSTHDPTAVAALLWQPRSRALSSGTGVLSLGETASPYVCKTPPPPFPPPFPPIIPLFLFLKLSR